MSDNVKVALERHVEVRTEGGGLVKARERPILKEVVGGRDGGLHAAGQHTDDAVGPGIELLHGHNWPPASRYAHRLQLRSANGELTESLEHQRATGEVVQVLVHDTIIDADVRHPMRRRGADVTTGTGYAHIVRDDDGHLRVGAGWHKLIMLVGEHVYRHSGPAEMVQAHPSLTLGQAYEVLAYYYDHQAELDAELAERARYGEEMQAAQGDEQRSRGLTSRYERRTPPA